METKQNLMLIQFVSRNVEKPVCIPGRSRASSEAAIDTSQNETRLCTLLLKCQYRLIRDQAALSQQAFLQSMTAVTRSKASCGEVTICAEHPHDRQRSQEIGSSLEAGNSCTELHHKALGCPLELPIAPFCLEISCAAIYRFQQLSLGQPLTLVRKRDIFVGK